MNEMNQEDAVKAIYELSQHPSFPILMAVIDTCGIEQANVPMPKTAEQQIAWQTACYARSTIDLVVSRIYEVVNTGYKLAQLANGGSHGEEDGHNGRDERSRI